MFFRPLTPNFDAALRDVTSKDENFRLRAAHGLAAVPEGREEEARAGLEALAKDRLGPIRAAAFEGLALVGVPAFVREGLSDEHAEVRQSAARALYALSEGKRPDVLSELAASDDFVLRFQAADLWRQEESVDAKALLKLLRDEDGRVRAAAADGLALAHHETAGEKDAIVTGLKKALTDGNEEVANAAAIALSYFGNNAGEVRLIRGLSHPLLAIEAAEALGRVASDRGKAALYDRGSKFFGSLLVRAACGRALVQLGDARGDEPLNAALKAWRADGRDYAIAAAGEYQRVALLPALARLCERLRGADPRLLAETLASIAEVEPGAASALERLKQKGYAV